MIPKGLENLELKSAGVTKVQSLSITEAVARVEQNSSDSSWSKSKFSGLISSVYGLKYRSLYKFGVSFCIGRHLLHDE